MLLLLQPNNIILHAGHSPERAAIALHLRLTHSNTSNTRQAAPGGSDLHVVALDRHLAATWMVYRVVLAAMSSLIKRNRALHQAHLLQTILLNLPGP